MTSPAGPPVHHEVDLSGRLQHLVRVTTTIPADLSPGARVVVATWTPGSYVERDYVHHLQQLAVTDATGAPVTATPDGRTAWLLPATVAGPVTVRTNHVDDEHALLVPPATFPLVEGAEDRPVTVEVVAAEDETVWSLLPASDEEEGPPPTGTRRFRADDQLHLVDSAFEVGSFRHATVDVDGVPHTWVHASTGGPIDLDRVTEDVAAIARAARDVVGGELPVDSYTFLCVGAGRGAGSGGLEHRDGSVLMLPVLTDTTDDGVARTRSLIAHEYFHLWNVKRLVPAELVELRLDRPTHTTSLWVAEGWTAYYDDLLPVRAGLGSPRALLDRLREDLQWVLRTPGARRQPLTESSWRAWTGLYVRDENSANAGTSYYTHGAVVALLLDLLIRDEAPDGDGLDEAFRLLWERFGHPHAAGYPSSGYTHDDVVAALSDAAGRDLADVVDEHVRGTATPPVADALHVVGCRLDASTAEDADAHLGVQVEEDDRGPVVRAVLRDGPAWRGGVTGGDRLLAVDGTALGRDDLGDLLGALEPGREVTVTVERDHRLRTLAVVPDEPLPTLRIVPLDERTDRQRAVFTRWCGSELATPTDGGDEGDG